MLSLPAKPKASAQMKSPDPDGDFPRFVGIYNGLGRVVFKVVYSYDLCLTGKVSEELCSCAVESFSL